MAVVYEHIRLDNEQIFYIGWGKESSRAYQKIGRNKHWKSVVKKYGYRVNIFAKGLTEEDAKEVEITEISRLGRSDLGNGFLVNKTNGGEGLTNPNTEVRNKIRDKTKARFSKQENRDKTSQSTKLAMKRPEVIIAMSNAQKYRFSKQENRDKTSENTKLAMKRPEVREKVLESNKRIGRIISTLKTIYKDTEEKRISQVDMEKYINEGWKLGRCPIFKLGRKNKP